MSRRRFLQVAGAGVAGATIGARVREARASERDPAGVFERLVRANDARLPALLERQGDRPRPTRGGARFETSTPSPPPAGPRASRRPSWPPSPPPGPGTRARRRSRTGSAWPRARFLALQHSDGTIDLPTTNFHSPPDTAFVLEPVCASLSVVRRTRPDVPPRAVADLERFARAAGEALVVGGIHTPNHRWVVCAALARLHALFPDPRYVARGSARGSPRGSTSTRTASSPSGAPPSTRRPATAPSSPWRVSSGATRSSSPSAATWR